MVLVMNALIKVLLQGIRKGLNFLLISVYSMTHIYAWNTHSELFPTFNATCLMLAENEYFTMVNLALTFSELVTRKTHFKLYIIGFQENKPATDKCAGFVCWESQLTLASKVNITRMYNLFRQKVSKQKEIASMLKMVLEAFIFIVLI